MNRADQVQPTRDGMQAGEGELPVLYSFRRCPYAIRARMALQVADVAVEIREVALRNKPEALRRLSPNATVPVLALCCGRVLHESLDILVWAFQQNDPHDWLATLHRPDLQRWVLRNDTDFKPLLDRYKYAPRHPELTQQAHRDKAVDSFIAPLEHALAQQPFLCGMAPGWADLALFPFVRQFAMVEPAWFAAAPLPNLYRWLDFWLASGWFTASMGKHPVWVDAASHPEILPASSVDLAHELVRGVVAPCMKR